MPHSPSKPALQQELHEARALALGAGRIALALYGNVKVELKGESDPVTEADRRANAFIVEGLAKVFPGDGIVAEESPQDAWATRQERCWFVDPLDGTKEFVAQNGEFSIMIGLSIAGRARVGVVYQPTLDKLYLGVLGDHGSNMATLTERGSTRDLSVSEHVDPRALKLVVSRSHRPSNIEQLMSKLGITEESPSGSVGLKIGHIAERTADLYVHLSNRSSRWDACAPEAILHAAGGRFTDVLGRPFDYTSPEIANTHGILACNAAAFDAVLPAVREIAQSSGFVG
jgi:3'(2'), 5'-bisphosphate nucleotidase